MTATLSKMIPLGTIAPDFTLRDCHSGDLLSLQSLKSSKGTVIMFLCNHCPFVIHVLPEILRVAKDYSKKGISFISISSNDPISYPEDAPTKWPPLPNHTNLLFPIYLMIPKRLLKPTRPSAHPTSLSSMET